MIRLAAGMCLHRPMREGLKPAKIRQGSKHYYVRVHYLTLNSPGHCHAHNRKKNGDSRARPLRRYRRADTVRVSRMLHTYYHIISSTETKGKGLWAFFHGVISLPHDRRHTHKSPLRLLLLQRPQPAPALIEGLPILFCPPPPPPLFLRFFLPPPPPYLLNSSCSVILFSVLPSICLSLTPTEGSSAKFVGSPIFFVGPEHTSSLSKMISLQSIVRRMVSS